MIFWLAQLLCYFCGIAVSTGGGNFPGQESSGYVYLKGLLIFIPIACVGLQMVVLPNRTFAALLNVFHRNLFVGLYFLTCLILIPLAVNWEYSLIRLSFTLFQLFSLFCLLVQIEKYDVSELRHKSLIVLSYGVLVLPFYVVIQGWMPGYFRYGLQTTNLIHPNILASFGGMLLVMHYIQLIYGERWKISSLLFIIILLMLQVGLFSRTALLAIAAAMVSLPFWNTLFQRSVKSAIICLGLLFALTTTATFILTGIVPAETFIGIFTRNDSVSSLMTLTNRTLLWSELIKNIDLRVFLTGYGYSVIAENYGVDLGTGILYGAHNAYLSVLLGSGFFALLCVLAYLIRNMITIITNRYALSVGILYQLLTVYLIFFIICFSSEEIGINLSINFSLLIMLTNMAFLEIRKARP